MLRINQEGRRGAAPEGRAAGGSSTTTASCCQIADALTIKEGHQPPKTDAHGAGKKQCVNLGCRTQAMPS